MLLPGRANVSARACSGCQRASPSQSQTQTPRCVSVWRLPNLAGSCRRRARRTQHVHRLPDEMNPNIVLSAHLSSLFASGALVNAIVVPTARRDLPLSQSNRHAIPDGHASHSSLFYHPLTGRILLRVVQGGLAVELVSLSASVPPIRFVFPAPVLPTPSLIVWQETHLHIVAVTTVGCVHRIILTISDESQLWHGHMRKDWCREFQLTRFSLSQISLCYIQDFHTVILGLKNGGCIRLFSDFIDDEQCDGEC